MRVLICPDKFKGSLSGREAAEAIRTGVKRALPDAMCTLQPLADGGEGSLEIIKQSGPYRERRLEVTGPLRRPVQARYLSDGKRALIESAEACGLHLVPHHRRNPANTTTIGVGQLVEDALARGAEEIMLYLGGSSTNDCGAGMAAALGYRFYGRDGLDFVPMADSLGYVDRIDGSAVSKNLRGEQIVAVCDVTNPLLGLEGATLTYAEQKGAVAADLPRLELQMATFARVLERDTGVKVSNLAGAGAAGGLGAGAVAFLGASLRRGIDALMQTIGFSALLNNCDLVITGEGKIDGQTLSGKVVAGVAEAAHSSNVPAIALAGVIGGEKDDLRRLRLSKLASIVDTLSISPTVSVEQAERRLADLAERVVSEYLAETSP